ncbi:MAG: T9SS type B sorting domain-containing protein [Bacteroidota bacterium]
MNSFGFLFDSIDILNNFNVIAVLDMKRSTLKLFCIFLFLSVSVNAQRETAHWFFGANAGLHFDSEVPTSVDIGQVDSLEGCASISTADGALLFYTDGITVWNREHQIMPNGTGLAGSWSSTQSSIIIPNPGNPNLFYVFTTDVVDAYSTATAPSNGFNYSVVDMSLNGGMGAVTVKNVNLLANTSEKVSATLSSDGNYWVITHRINSFYAYKVTTAGVNQTPTVSSTPNAVTDFRNIRGNMKISPNGSTLAIAHTIFEPNQTGELFIYDFDATTGMVSNEQFISSEIAFYGVEFSSSSELLYTSGKVILSNFLTKIQLLQYDLTANDIPATRHVVHDYPTAQVTPSLAGSLQLGLDKRIYHALPVSYLSTINFPNLVGASCGFELASVDLDDRFARFGLPAAVQSFFESIIKIENFCLGDTTNFTVNSDNTITGIQWDFGDPASGTANTSTAINPTHIFSSAGVFTVTATVSFANIPNQLFIETVIIEETPNIASLYVLVQCDGGVDDTDGISLFDLDNVINRIEEDHGNDDITIVLFETIDDALANENGITSNLYVNDVNNQLLYARVFVYVDCFAIAQIRLQVNAGSNLGVHDTISICELDTTSIAISEVITQLQDDFPQGTLSIHETRNQALLQNNQLSATTVIDVNAVDELFFRVSYGTTCGFVGSVLFAVAERPSITDQEVFLCNAADASVVLAFEETFASYLWSTNETTSSITVDAIGNYSVIVTNAAGCEKEVTFTVLQEPELLIDRIDIRDFQDVNTITIVLTNEVNLENIEYSINGGATFSTANRFENIYPGVYDIVVRHVDCSEITETILVGGFPEYFTPNGDTINDRWELLKKEYYPNANIAVFDRYGKNIVNIKSEDAWDGTYRGIPLPSGDYWYKLTLESGRVVTGHVTMRR